MSQSKSFFLRFAFVLGISSTSVYALPDLPFNYYTQQKDAILQQANPNDPPANIQHRIWPSKKAVTLTWEKPTKASKGISYQVNDANNHMLWKGSNTTFTDSSLTGKSGTVTYFIYSNNEGKLSPSVSYEVTIN